MQTNFLILERRASCAGLDPLIRDIPVAHPFGAHYMCPKRQSCRFVIPEGTTRLFWMRLSNAVVASWMKPSKGVAWMRLLFPFFCAMLLLPLFAFASHLEATVDRDSIGPDETFTLVVTVDEQTTESPDFSSLKKDFYLLSLSQSQRIILVNQKNSAQTEWRLTLSPRVAGKLSIPALSLGNDHSLPIAVEVGTHKEISGPDILQSVFMRAEVDKSQAYLQSQISYVLKIYYKVNLRNVSIDNPQVENGQVFSMGADKEYQTNLQGRSYQVVERHFAIIPERAGTLNIKPPVLIGQIGKAASMPVSTLDSMVTLNTSAGRTVRTAAPQLSIEVLPIPEELRNEPWLPSEHVTLSDSWKHGTPAARVGEPILRTVTIRAKGVTAAQLPMIHFNDLPGIKIYPERPELKNDSNGHMLIASRQQSFTFIPTRAGKLSLPPMEIHYWDPLFRQRQMVALTAAELNVADAPALDTFTRTAAPPSALASVKNSLAHHRELLFAFLGLVAFALVLGTFFLFFGGKQTWARHTQAQSCRHRLRKACQDHDPILCKQVLLEWAALVWPLKRFSSLSSLLTFITDPALRQALSDLDRALYSPQEHSSWSGKPLFAAWSSFKIPRTPRRKFHVELAPLYPPRP